MSDRGHVLIIDHDAHSTRTIRKILVNNGNVVDNGASAEDTLAILPKLEPNLFLINTSLPDITPSAITQKLKDTEKSLYLVQDESRGEGS